MTLPPELQALCREMIWSDELGDTVTAHLPATIAATLRAAADALQRNSTPRLGQFDAFATGWSAATTDHVRRLRSCADELDPPKEATDDATVIILLDKEATDD